MRRVSLVRDGNDFKNIILCIPPGCQAVLSIYSTNIHSSIVHCRCMIPIAEEYVCYDVATILYRMRFTILYFYFHFVTTAALAQNTDGIARYSNGGGAWRGRGPQSVVMEFQNSGNNQSQTHYNTNQHHTNNINIMFR